MSSIIASTVGPRMQKMWRGGARALMRDATLREARFREMARTTEDQRRKQSYLSKADDSARMAAELTAQLQESPSIAPYEEPAADCSSGSLKLRR
jgi:hypothetical protein